MSERGPPRIRAPASVTSAFSIRSRRTFSTTSSPQVPPIIHSSDDDDDEEEEEIQLVDVEELAPAATHGTRAAIDLPGRMR